MREKDKEIDLTRAESNPARVNARRIGEKLLFLDELEDTLDQVRSSGGATQDRIDALERRVTAERETIRALETRGELRYDEITRVMEAVDRSG